MNPYLLIQKKRDGHTLDSIQIKEFVDGYVGGAIPDYQMSAFLMAVFFKGMTPEETAALTDSMMKSGDMIAPSELGTPTADKHSTGGVGDKISIILAPLVAAAGVRVPMMSGRGLGHTGGTLDKLESIPGFTTQLTIREMKELIDDIGVAMIGQTDRMVPADKKMYALRDVTATVDCIPLIAASIMSKKVAAGPQNLVLDVKVGRGAFMKNIDLASKLACQMVGIGSAHHRNVRAILTDMDTHPLGCAVGNSLEIMECIETLQGKGPSDIRELTLILGSHMLTMAGKSPDENTAKSTLKNLLDNGKAFQKFLEMVKHQNGDPDSVIEPYKLPLAKHKIPVPAPQSGYITGIDPMTIGLASVELGAGRKRQDDQIDLGVGFMIETRTGSHVEQGDNLCTIYSSRPEINVIVQAVQNAFEIDESPPPKKSLIHDIILPNEV